MCGDRIHGIGCGLCRESRDDPCLIVLDPLQCNELRRGEIFEEHLKHLERCGGTVRSGGLQLLMQLRERSTDELIGEKICSDRNGGNRYAPPFEMAGRVLKEPQ